jgi:hypothetical protein
MCHGWRKGAKITRMNRAILPEKESEMPGLYHNINAKRERIAKGSGERMRKAGAKGAPTAASFKAAAKTAKPAKKGK